MSSVAATTPNTSSSSTHKKKSSSSSNNNATPVEAPVVVDPAAVTETSGSKKRKSKSAASTEAPAVEVAAAATTPTAPVAAAPVAAAEETGSAEKKAKKERKSKASTTAAADESATPASVAAAPPAPVATPAAAAATEEAAPKKKRASKAAAAAAATTPAPAAAAPVVAPAVVASSSSSSSSTAAAATSAADAESETSFANVFKEFSATLLTAGIPKGVVQKLNRAASKADKEIAATQKKAQAQHHSDSVKIAKLQKRVDSQAAEITNLSKEKGGRRRRNKKASTPKLDENGNIIPRRPSGITAPGRLSSAMCKFINVPDGTLMSRVALIKIISDYITAHGLRNTEKGKGAQIVLDDKLAALFAHAPPDFTFTLFSMQKVLGAHVAPIAPPAV